MMVKNSNGFMSICLRCKNNKVKIEMREDGIDFQCMKCGNKMLIRPGESFQIQTPEEIINKKTRDFEKILNESTNEEEINKILSDWQKKQEE